MLARHGYGVLLFDRRGEGRSEGGGNMLGWGGDKDIIAAVDWLKKRPDVDPDRIGGIGFSVGGELMLEAAAKDPDLAAVVSDGAGARQFVESKKALPGAGLLGHEPSFALLNASVGVFSDTAPPESLSDLVPRIAPRPLLFIWAPDGGNETEVLTPDYHRDRRTERVPVGHPARQAHQGDRGRSRRSTSAGSSRSSTTRCSSPEDQPRSGPAAGAPSRGGGALATVLHVDNGSHPTATLWRTVAHPPLP